MIYIHDALRSHLLTKKGLLEVQRKMITLKELEDKTHYDTDEFMSLMFNRIMFGHLRYGEMKHNKKYDYIKSAKMKLDLFLGDGNLEHLVDAANYCLIEFRIGQHPKRHFESQDDVNHAIRK
jgi:hypothetical protein